MHVVHMFTQTRFFYAGVYGNCMLVCTATLMVYRGDISRHDGKVIRPAAPALIPVSVA